tara:strand:- start:2956 stop:3831 length:876 start_codon:yes stop_codon:yes gene_type:complete
MVGITKALYELKGVNLFTSHFVIGCKECNLGFTKTHTEQIDSLHKWMNWKNTDYAMDRYRTKHTQYIDFLHIIDLEELESVLKLIVKNYKIENPYSDKIDFLKNTFSYTIWELEEFIKNADIHYLGQAPNEDRYEFHTFYDRLSGEFVDYAIDSNFSIDYYKQYYKRVIELINQIDFEKKEVETVKSEAPTLSDLINFEQGQELVNQIKIKYKNIKGKRLKLLLLSLQKLDLLPQERMGQKFHNACKEEFNWDVSSYEAMRSYVYNEYTDNDECLKMEEFISNITKRTEHK